MEYMVCLEEKWSFSCMREELRKHKRRLISFVVYYPSHKNLQVEAVLQSDKPLWNSCSHRTVLVLEQHCLQNLTLVMFTDFQLET